MPEAPDVSVITRYLFENPWPLGGGLVLLAAVLLWIGVSDGRTDRLKQAIVPGVLGLAVIAIAFSVETAGEAGRTAVRGLVAEVVVGDIDAALGHVSDNVRFHRVRIENAAVRLEAVELLLRLTASRYPIESNIITNLDAYTTGDDTATVFLSCLTDLGTGLQTTKWHLETRRGPKGEALIERIVWVERNGQPATGWP